MSEESTNDLRGGWLPRLREARLKSPLMGDLTPVPVDMVERVWPAARSLIRAPKTGIGREYDVDRLHGRLLVGIDRLWIAALTRACNYDLENNPFCGLVITSIGPAPKDSRTKPLFYKEKSITIHLIAGKKLYVWIDDAVEKIAAYAEAQNLRQAFVLARNQWRHYALRFYPHFEKMGLARDRFTKRGRNPGNGRQRPGHFLHVEPMPPGMKYDTARCSRRRNFIQPPKGEAHVIVQHRPGNAA